MKRIRAVAAAVIAIGLFATGCADRGEQAPNQNQNQTEESQGRQYSEGMIGEESGGTPVSGGTLRYAAFTEPASLDPSRILAAGGTGGTEMSAIYDTLMRYQASDRTFVPKMAEGVTPDDDHTVWTLKLRDGVKFSDGQVLDAAAVKASQERYANNNGPESALWKANVTGIRVVDPLTVEYTLARPWPLFVGILSSGPGMIVTPDAGNDQEYVPIGAGPFMVETWSPKEHLTLKVNPNYWGEKPHLEAIRAVYLPNEDARAEALQSGGVDVAMMRAPKWVDQMLDDGTRGYNSVVAAGNMALINASPGRPGEDARVRKAMALALDPQTVADRAYDGYGLAGSTIFPSYSRWATETQGLSVNQEEAKALLEEAKADGYDGKVTYLDFNAPDREAIGLAFKGALESVGFEVELNLVRGTPERFQHVLKADYDVVGHGQSFREADPFSKMYTTMHSKGNQLYGGYTSPEMDALLEEFQASADEAEQIEILDRIQQKFNEDVPFLNWGPVAEFVAFNDNVHGVVGATNSTVQFDKAWIG